MALTLYASVGSTTTQLNDGAPFKLESAEGLSGGGVTRYFQSGPFQNGQTDLGFRLQPVGITLNLLFYASTAALLDTYRSTLMAAFKPLDSTSTFLSVLRDDGTIRTLVCFAEGDIDIALVPENYPGHLHRATVNLRAANPLWRANDATIGTADISGITQWYLAGGAIAQANVMRAVAFPAQNSLTQWGGAGTITGDWSVAIVTAKETVAGGTIGSGPSRNAWSDGNGGSASLNRNTAGSFAIADGILATTWPGTTDYNYHVVESRGGTQFWRYWTAGSITSHFSIGTDVSLKGGSLFTWRGDRLGAGKEWSPEIPRGVILGTVTVNQLQALGPYILGSVGGSVTVVNSGDVYAYPLIRIRGPISDLVIVNTTTSSTIDLTGLNVPQGDVATLDLRGGNKQLYNAAGSSLLGSVTTLPVNLAGFALAPSPVAAGGTNNFSFTIGTAGTAGTNAAITVQITNQYMSF